MYLTLDMIKQLFMSLQNKTHHKNQFSRGKGLILRPSLTNTIHEQEEAPNPY